MLAFRNRISLQTLWNGVPDSSAACYCLHLGLSSSIKLNVGIFVIGHACESGLSINLSACMRLIAFKVIESNAKSQPGSIFIDCTIWSTDDDHCETISVCHCQLD